ncbi:hypothetical protein FAZ15_20110 [Sphingobacterium olei]|uniref:Uncharacterized protein n=1 Tax=Sphingobacterium olei TaxID=2571155 RepID=A0A4U0NBS8_9SPHI|nr:hypothetical protein [Sphingobacterium olei]TJZ51425.1 hypothetical protein FAZ15_20110 [Sphingobacterium olei]
MEKINSTLLQQLTQIRNQPCISLYMPTHRVHPESATDPILFKNLVKKIQLYITENKLTDYMSLLEPFEKLQNDYDFWNNNDCGLAIFSAKNETHIIRLPERVEEITCVANSFCVKPLFKFHAENKEYYLLALGQDDVRLYTGDKYHLEKLNIQGNVPTSMTEALGSELTDNHVHSTSAPTSHVHGYMEKSQEEDIDIERFFRSVDQALNSHFDFSHDKPLILAALAEHHTEFKAISKNQHLHEHHITINAEALNIKELLTKVKKVIETEHTENIRKLLDRQQIAAQQKLSSHEIRDVAYDVMDGKVEILFLENGRNLSGEIDLENRKVHLNENKDTDILNELAYLVFERGGQIILLDKDDMPYDTGAFTINRF